MNCIDLDNFKTLEDVFTKAEFVDEVADKFTSLDFGDVLYADELSTTFKNFLKGLAKVIYEQYSSDLLAYINVETFIKRITITLTKNINYYFQTKNIHFLIGSNEDTNKYTLTSTLSTNTKENGIDGSSVIQSSASTPTSVNPSGVGGYISSKITEVDGEKKLNLEDDTYNAKYTNFQGKTNGLHQNEVSRDGNSIRSGSFLQAIEMLKNLPKNYIDEVLEDVGLHFILVYPD